VLHLSNRLRCKRIRDRLCLWPCRWL